MGDYFTLSSTFEPPNRGEHGFLVGCAAPAIGDEEPPGVGWLVS